MYFFQIKHGYWDQAPGEGAPDGMPEGPELQRQKKAAEKERGKKGL